MNIKETFQLTAEDVLFGIHNNCVLCAFSRALARENNLQNRELGYVDVKNGGRFSIGTDLYFLTPPKLAKLCIEEYDECRTLEKKINFFGKWYSQVWGIQRGWKIY